MLRSRLLAAAAVACASLTFTSAAAAYPDVAYVAFGDSYASGPGLDSSGNDCGRSATQNYPSRVASKFGLPSTNWADYSCAGATWGWGLSTQTTEPYWGGLKSQLSWAVGEGKLGAATVAVTISIGGNSVWNASRKTPYESLGECAKGPGLGAAACSASTPNVIQTSDITSAKLVTELQSTLAAIRSAAPTAQILLVSYPTIFPRVGQGVCADNVIWWNPVWKVEATELPYANAITNELRAAQSSFVSGLGSPIKTATAKVKAVDLYNTSTVNDFCRTTNKWVDGPAFNISTGGLDPKSLHPTVAGHDQFATTIKAAYLAP